MSASTGMLNRGERRGRGERWSPAPAGTRQTCVCGRVCVWFHSHSVVPGGLEVRSYMTLEIPGIFLISFTIFSTTCEHREGNITRARQGDPTWGGSRSLHTSSGMWLPGVAGTPVMKSLVIKVRITTERRQDGCFCSGSRSKCRGVRMMGIWLIFPE